MEVIDVDDNGIFKLSAEKTEIVPQPTRGLTSVEQLLPVAFSSRIDLKAAQQQVFVKPKGFNPGEDEEDTGSIRGRRWYLFYVY